MHANAMTTTILIILILVLLLINNTLASSSSSSRSNTTTTNIGFIRRSCGETLYPDLCYTSLSGYAYAVQKDPAVLTRIAIGLTLFRARRFLANLSTISSSPPASISASSSSALHDCVSVFGDAVDQIRGSLKQMRRLTNNITHDHHHHPHHQAEVEVLVSMGDDDDDEYSALRLGLNDVQTWMSAALTNEDTCTEGLEEERNNNYSGHMHNYNWDIEELCDRATKVKHVTSNALALLNSYVAIVSSPPPLPVPPPHEPPLPMANISPSPPPPPNLIS